MAVPANILELAQKLQNMTTENGCTPSEAANAAERLQRLLQTHQLSISDIGAKTIGEDVEELQLTRPDGGKWGYGVKEFANCVALAFDCKLLASSKMLYFIGIESDVKVATFFFEQTNEKIMTAGRIRGRTERFYGASLTHYVQNFISGAGQAIYGRLKRQPTQSTVYTCEEASRVQACNALVPVKKEKVEAFVKQRFPITVKGKMRTAKSGSDDGYVYGSNMELRHGLEGASGNARAAIGGGVEVEARLSSERLVQAAADVDRAGVVAQVEVHLAVRAHEVPLGPAA